MPGAFLTVSLRTSVRIARASSPQFANVNTVLVSTVIEPLLATLLLVAVAASVGGEDLRSTAYAGVLLAAAISVISALNRSLAFERNARIIPDALFPRFGTPAYWLGKPVLPVASALVVAAIAMLGILAVDPETNLSALWSALRVLPFAVVVGSVIGICLAVVSLLVRDPYLLSNIFTGLLPLTAGVIAPLSAYPPWARNITEWLPMTWTIQGMRQDSLPSINELVVCLPWVILAMLSLRYVKRRIRSGQEFTFL